jgi:hypothetical protein
MSIEAELASEAVERFIQQNRHLWLVEADHIYIVEEGRRLEVRLSSRAVAARWSALEDEADGLDSDVVESVARLLGIYLMEGAATAPPQSRALTFRGTGFYPDAVETTRSGAAPPDARYGPLNGGPQ